MKFQRLQQAKRREVAIIPMIDILLILIIFIVVSTQFKKDRKALVIDLPVEKGLNTQTLEKPRSILAVNAEGKVLLDNIKVPQGLLTQYLKEFKKQNPNQPLELEADRKLPLEKLLEIWADLKAAGIEIKDVPARIRES